MIFKVWAKETTISYTMIEADNKEDARMKAYQCKVHDWQTFLHASDITKVVEVKDE